MNADLLLRAAGRRSPGLVRLALLLSPAVRIEPELMRAVRLESTPTTPAGREGELWFSPLVSARGPDGVVLHGEVANLLRERARRILLPQAPGESPPADGVPTKADIRRAWRLIEHMHADSPPVLRLEEKVNWIAVSEEEPEADIEAELRLAVDALRRGRIGIARWAARALPRMPDAARSTAAAWLLAQGARHRLRSGEWTAQARNVDRIDDLAALLPARDDVPLGVKRFGERLDIGEVGRDGVSIRVLDTEPRLLAVSAAEWEGEQIVQVSRGHRESVNVGRGPVLLRTPRGEIYKIDDSLNTALSELRRSCVRVLAQRPGEEAAGLGMGIAVAPDRVLTVLSPGETQETVTVTGQSGVPVIGGSVMASRELLALLRVPHLPEDTEPAALPLAGASPPRAGDQWYGLSLSPDGAWSTVTGIITAAKGESLIATPATPAEQFLRGSPVVVDGTLTGLVTHRTSGRQPDLGVAAVADFLNLDPSSGRLWSLTLAADAIALEFHMRFGGFRRGGAAELDTNALMAGAGLLPEQLDRVRGAAEYVVKSGVESRTRPRWLPPSGAGRFSDAVMPALDEATEAFQSLSQRSYTLWGRRFPLTAAARDSLADIGVTFVPAALGGVAAELDTGRFTAGGLRRLLGMLADELPQFDQWDPWLAAPAAGADRPQALLEVVSAICGRETRVPEPARTVLMQADDYLYPDWWQVRDDLVRVSVPDIGANHNFPDFLEAYLGWCLTVLQHVGISSSDYSYQMGYSIPGPEIAALPTERFGLGIVPGSSANGEYLAGRFSSLIGFSAWVFIELADHVRLVAAQPPQWPRGFQGGELALRAERGGDAGCPGRWARPVRRVVRYSTQSASRTQGTHRFSPMLGSAVSSRTPSDFQPRSYMGSAIWPATERQAEAGPHMGWRLSGRMATGANEESAHTPPFSIYSAPGDLRQDPGRAA